MKLDYHFIAFRKGGILVPNKDRKTDVIHPEVIQFNLELIRLGYTLKEEDMYALDDNFVRLHGESTLKGVYNFLGYNKDWKPFHKGFPQSVISATEAELYYSQMKHYLYGWVPEEVEIKEKPEQEDEYYYRAACTLNLYIEDDIIEIYKRLLSTNQSISSSEIEVIDSLLKEGKNVIPDKIPFKENLAVLVSLLGPSGVKYCTGINDVLRSIMYSLKMPVLLNLPKKKIKDVSRWRSTTGWIENPERSKYKFPNIPRKNRKEYLDMIETYLVNNNFHTSAESILDDLKKSKKFWIKLAEKIHPGEYMSTHPRTFVLFETIRNYKLRGFYSNLHEAYKQGQDEVLELLSRRPGEFIRRFDSLYRREGYSKSKTLNSLIDLEKNPSTKVILEFLDHFSKRTKEYPREIRLPGARETFALPTLHPLSEGEISDLRNYSLIILQENYEKQESLEGKIAVLSEDLDDIRLPKDMRSMSDSLKVVSRGTAFDIPKDVDYLRAYTYWFDPTGNNDLDLSACFLDENFNELQSIAWNSYHKNDYSVHSGDVRLVQGDCAEYVDIDIDKAIKSGVTWVFIDVNDYSGNGFHLIDNKSGICGIKKLEASLHWKPSGNILQALSLSTPGDSVIAFALNLPERKFYYLDEDISHGGIPVGTYNSQKKTNIVRGMVEAPFVSVKELLKINFYSRKADIISLEEYNALDEEEKKLPKYMLYTKDEILKDISLLKNILE